MQTGPRKLLMAFLVVAFVTQTALVYSDDTAMATPPLSEAALAGRALWHRHNCHTCHQVYGFGGFLGPDLTNAASRVTRQRLDEILTRGSGQMPAFAFSPEQIDAMEAYLRALDATGIGQARARTDEVDAAEVESLLDQHATEGTLSEAGARGRQVFRYRCTTCHRLFQPTPLGPFMAPDLTDAHGRLSDDVLRDVIVNGRPSRGMVPPPLSSEEVDDVLAFLEWLAEHRHALRARVGAPADGGGIPWFEYR